MNLNWNFRGIIKCISALIFVILFTEPLAYAEEACPSQVKPDWGFQIYSASNLAFTKIWGKTQGDLVKDVLQATNSIPQRFIVQSGPSDNTQPKVCFLSFLEGRLFHPFSPPECGAHFWTQQGINPEKPCPAHYEFDPNGYNYTCRLKESEKDQCKVCDCDEDEINGECVKIEQKTQVEISDGGDLEIYKYRKNNQGLRCPAITRKKRQCDSQSPVSELLGNPIDCTTGAKVEELFSYKGHGESGLAFSLFYSGKTERNPASYLATTTKRLSIETIAGVRLATVTSSGRESHPFIDEQGVWKNYSGDKVSLTTTGDRTEFSSPSGYTDTFDGNGRLIQHESRTNPASSFTVEHTDEQDGSHVEDIQNAFGRHIQARYNSSDQLDEFVDQAGRTYHFEYDSIGNLKEIKSESVRNGLLLNLSKRYLYENASFPNALTGIIDESGSRYATFEYNDKGYATSTKHAGNNGEVTLEYAGSQTTFINESPSSSEPLKKTYTFTVKQGKSLIASIRYWGCNNCALGNAVDSYTYDEQGNLVAHIDKSMNQYLYEYDSQGRKIKSSTPYKIETILWDDILNKPKKVTDNSQSTEYEYHSSGLLKSETKIDKSTNKKRTTGYSFNHFGLLESKDGPRDDVNDIDQYSYDASGNLSRITNPLGHITTFSSYNANGYPGTMTDANRVSSTFTYDEDGRILSVIKDGKETILNYSNIGLLERTRLSNGVVYSYEYDAAHRLIAVENQSGERVEFELDYKGNLKGETYKSANGNVTKRGNKVYNALGQLTTVINSKGNRTDFSYDPLGFQSSVKDPEGKTISITNDAIGRITNIRFGDGSNTELYYDDINRESTYVRDPNGIATSYTRDAFGQVTKEVNPNTGTTTYTYDSAGNIKTRTDARGVMVTYTYDALNRVTTADYPGVDDDLIYTYDNPAVGAYGIGRLWKVEKTDGSGITYTYNALGRLASVQQRMDDDVYVTHYEYDSEGLLTKVIYPSQREFIYQRNNLGQISQLDYTAGGTTTTLASNLQYLPFGPLTHLTYENGLTLTREFDNDYQLIGQRVPGQLDWSYDYWPSGNLKSVSDGLAQGGNRNYTYNALYRLLSAAGDNGNFEYLTDRAGNRTGATENGVSDSYVLSSNSQRLAKLTRDGVDRIVFAYDAMGNVTQRGDLTLRYNAWGRLAQVERGGQVLASYTYNPLGQRVIKTVAGVKTYFHYDQYGRLVEESRDGNTYLRAYAYVDNQLISELDVATGKRYAIHTDHLGTPVRLTDADKAVAWQASNDPFGKAHITTESVTLNLRSKGQYFDAETGFHYNYFREYDPETGRYLQSDPIGLAGGINTYAFVVGNPVNFTDPLGLEKCACDVAALAVDADLDSIVKDYGPLSEAAAQQMTNDAASRQNRIAGAAGLAISIGTMGLGDVAAVLIGLGTYGAGELLPDPTYYASGDFQTTMNFSHDNHHFSITEHRRGNGNVVSRYVSNCY